MRERNTTSCRTWSVFAITASLTCALFLFVPALLQEAIGQSPAKLLSPEEVQQLGQRMYRKGILASGEKMQSVIKGDITVQGTTFTCVSCHMLSGLGSSEGDAFITPTNGKSLYNPRQPPRGIVSSMSGGMSKSKDQPPQLPLLPPPGRPAYSDDTLATALREGIDPSGRVLNPVMPQYLLQDQDMAILISYLKALSSKDSPGVAGQTLRFATVISEDVPAELRYKQAALLEKLFSRMNEQARDYEKRLKDPKLNRHMSKTWRMLYRNTSLTLSRWLLKGAPETWPAQLEEYNRKEPVFALLGGITSGDWKPVHDFCESNRIPCLFPQTDYPIVSEANSYTFYLSKGFYQEGEAAARFINRSNNDSTCPPVVQIVRNSREGQALSAGFEEAWRDLGHPPPATFLLQPGESISPEALAKLAKDQPVTLLVWDGSEALPLLTYIANMKGRPETIFISSSYFGKKVTALPEHIRDSTYITHPYRLPQDEQQLEEFYLGTSVKSRINTDETNRILKRSYPLTRVLIDALSEMKENFYRDYFLDVISNHKDLDVPLYERLSFAPGQRYASRGCYIVQLSKGSNPELVRKSDWVIH